MIPMQTHMGWAIRAHMRIGLTLDFLIVWASIRRVDRVDHVLKRWCKTASVFRSHDSASALRPFPPDCAGEADREDCRAANCRRRRQ
jgi:hypothetical protein